MGINNGLHQQILCACKMRNKNKIIALGGLAVIIGAGSLMFNRNAKPEFINNSGLELKVTGDSSRILKNSSIGQLTDADKKIKVPDLASDVQQDIYQKHFEYLIRTFSSLSPDLNELYWLINQLATTAEIDEATVKADNYNATGKFRIPNSE